MGVDGFSATVSDAEGLTDTAEVRVEVATETFTSPGGQQVWLDLNAGAVGGSPAGAVSISLSPYQSPAVNLVIAMDSSGSVGNVGWGDLTDAVQQALLDIATLFDGTGIDVDAHVFGFSGQTTSTLYIQVADGSAAPATMTGAPGTSVADVDLDLSTVGALNAQIDFMAYPAGTTPWNAAFQQAEAYFDAEFIEDGENALNLMLFITDGNPYPTQQDWQQSLANLINENFIQSGASGLPGAGVYQPLASDTDTYSVDIQSFGVGTNLNMTALGDTDSDGSATPVNSFQDLSAALSGSALFPAELVSLEVTLAVDGAAAVSIADETTPGLQVGSVSIDLALADIAGIEGLLGDVNEVAVQAVFDLDGDLGTTTDQVTLNSLEQIAFGADALIFVGTDGNDLALGSDGSDHMQAGLGNDVLLAGLGSDTVIGGAGDDRLGGGADADDFVFAAGDGLDTILDYNAAEDQITFTGGLAFGDLTIQQAGADVTISHGSDLITVLSASATDFIADEFVFL
jgi:Ca2+-binding RTX toxin-like protein